MIISFDDVVAWIRRFAGRSSANKDVSDRAGLGDRRRRPRHQHGPRVPGGRRQARRLSGRRYRRESQDGRNRRSSRRSAVPAGPLYGTFFLQFGMPRPATERSCLEDLADSVRCWDRWHPAAREGGARRQDDARHSHARPATLSGEPWPRRVPARLPSSGRCGGRGRHEGDDPARRPEGPRELPGRAQRRAPGSGRDVVSPAPAMPVARRGGIELTVVGLVME